MSLAEAPIKKQTRAVQAFASVWNVFKKKTLLFEDAMELSETMDREELLGETARCARKLGFSNISIYEFRKGPWKMEDELVCVLSEGTGAAEMLVVKSTRNPSKALWKCLESGKPYVDNDARNSRSAIPETVKAKEQRAYVDVPIGKYGVIAADKSSHRLFWRITERDKKRLEFLAANIEKLFEKQAQNEELRAKNETIAAQKEALEKETARLHEAASRLIHDVNTDLTVAKLSAEKAREEPWRLDKVIERINKACAMIEDVVNKMRNGDSKNRSKFDLAELVGEIARGLSVDGARIEFEVPSIQIEWDRMNMQRALENVIGNGLKYNDMDQKEIRIIGTVNEGHVIVDVKDNGLGINPAEWELIFEKYRSPVTASLRKGDGIGLTIAKVNLEDGGGSISVLDSVSGEGTTFRLLIPLKAEAAK